MENELFKMINIFESNLFSLIHVNYLIHFVIKSENSYNPPLYRTVLNKTIEILEKIYELIPTGYKLISGPLVISYLERLKLLTDSYILNRLNAINLRVLFIDGFYIIRMIEKTPSIEEEVTKAYPSIYTLSLFKNEGFYKLMVLDDILANLHGSIKSKYLTSYNKSLYDILALLKDGRFLQLCYKGRNKIKVTMYLFRLHPTLVHYPHLSFEIYENVSNIKQLDFNIAEMKQRVEFLAMLLRNLRNF